MLVPAGLRPDPNRLNLHWIVWVVLVLIVLGGLGDDSSSSDTDYGGDDEYSSYEDSADDTAVFCAAYQLVIISDGDTTWEEDARYQDECE